MIFELLQATIRGISRHIFAKRPLINGRGGCVDIWLVKGRGAREGGLCKVTLTESVSEYLHELYIQQKISYK